MFLHQTVPSLPITQRKEASSSSKAFAIGSQTTSYLIVPVALPSLHFASAQNELFVASQTVPILFLLQFTLPGYAFDHQTICLLKPSQSFNVYLHYYSFKVAFMLVLVIVKTIGFLNVCIYQKKHIFSIWYLE